MSKFHLFSLQHQAVNKKIKKNKNIMNQNIFKIQDKLDGTKIMKHSLMCLSNSFNNYEKVLMCNVLWYYFDVECALYIIIPYGY